MFNRELYEVVSANYRHIFNEFNKMLDNVIIDELDIGYQPEECLNVLPI